MSHISQRLRNNDNPLIASLRGQAVFRRTIPQNEEKTPQEVDMAQEIRSMKEDGTSLLDVLKGIRGTDTKDKIGNEDFARRLFFGLDEPLTKLKKGEENKLDRTND